MAALALQRIEYGTPEGRARLDRLRSQLSAAGNVVSERGKALTIKVFGSPLTPIQVVERVCEDVRTRGAETLFHYTKQFDNAQITPDTLRVTSSEMALAHAAVDPLLLDAVRRVRHNVLTFQLGLLHRDACLSQSGLYQLRLRYRPVRRAGILIPGGATAYPSTLLMTVCPALAAGVQELVVVMPPTAHGAYNRDLLAVCHELGVREVYRVGGAQAVAALAYGVKGLPAVDMIVGPGNLFVALAKKYVFGQVAIDCIAGPSEVVVVADDSASSPGSLRGIAAFQPLHRSEVIPAVGLNQPIRNRPGQQADKAAPEGPVNIADLGIWRPSTLPFLFECFEHCVRFEDLV